MNVIVLMRGAGDLASGVALRLHRSGFRVIMTELAQPVVVRRMVSFAEAIYRGEFEVEGVVAKHAEELSEVQDIFIAGKIPILVNPEGSIIDRLKENTWDSSRFVLIDGRMI